MKKRQKLFLDIRKYKILRSKKETKMNYKKSRLHPQCALQCNRSSLSLIKIVNEGGLHRSWKNL